MLALLKPWRTASDLKSDGTSWSATLEGYIANSPPIIQQIVAGMQFYYDSKAASESSAEEESGEGRGHRCGNEVFDNATEGDTGSPATTLPHLVLTEHDLEVYKKVQKSS